MSNLRKKTMARTNGVQKRPETIIHEGHAPNVESVVCQNLARKKSQTKKKKCGGMERKRQGGRTSSNNHTGGRRDGTNLYGTLRPPTGGRKGKGREIWSTEKPKRMCK